MTLKDNGGNYEVSTLKGSCAECSEMLKFNYFGGESPHYLVDRLQPDGATLILKSEEGHGRMFVYEDAGYKVISSSVVIGAIANSDSLNIKPYLLSEFVNYFIGYNPVTALAESLYIMNAGNAFPNPLAGQTTISFHLAEPARVSVQIYNMNGQLVKKLAEGKFTEGEHELTWHADDTKHSKVKQGFYYCTIQAGDISITKKLVVLPQASQ